MEPRPHASPRTVVFAQEAARRFLATLPFFLGSAAFAAVPAMPILFLFWLMGPTVLPNPGMASYSAPPRTRLEPLPPYTDLSESGESSTLLSNPARNYARPYAAHDGITHEYAQQGHPEMPTLVPEIVALEQLRAR